MGRKTKQDPQGQRRNQEKFTRKVDSRIAAAGRKVRDLFKSIDRTKSSVKKLSNQESTVVFDYDIDSQGLTEFDRSTQFILNDELLETQTDEMPFDWYLKSDIELAYRQGTVEEVRDFNREVVGAATVAGALIGGMKPEPVEIEQVLLSEPYRQRVASAQAEVFRSIKSLGDKTAAQAMQRITSGIDAGKPPAEIIDDIANRFSVAKSGAKRTVRTEVSKAYNNAKLAATDAASERTGLRTGVIHISALLPTTREEHAARHGNVYTTDDQLQWWETGANRINCYCTTKSVFLDKDGKVVDQELQQSTKAERKFFDPD